MGGTGQREVTAPVSRPRLEDLTAPPNLLSLLRLALTPAVLALLVGGERAWAVAALLLMALTDGLDGYVARRTGRVTALGKVLDPLADKVAVDSVLLLLAVRGEFPVWALAVILARDCAIAVTAAVMARRTGAVPAANAAGKAAFVALAALAVVFAADIGPLETPALTAALALVAVSSVSYIGRMVAPKPARGDGRSGREV